MSAVMLPVRLWQNPVKIGLFSSRFGSMIHRVLPKSTRYVSGPGLDVDRMALCTTSPKARGIHYISCMRSEKEAAFAAASVPPDSPTIFDEIISKEIPATVVYEDEKVLAFRDINPQAPTHILIIPKVKDGLTGLSKADERHFEILGRLLYTAKLVAKQEGLEDGFRIVINDGPKGCQSVYHIHVHLLGGRQMEWPAG
ncbi:hypothetical protein vseg_007781 [Gypsophila vaccaria]